jgi:ribonuclease P/MRP protein subunit POP1
MAPKRKNNEEPTARERKKQKMAEARTIAVQSTTPRSVPNNPVAGPSKSVAFVDSDFSSLICSLCYANRHLTVQV